MRIGGLGLLAATVLGLCAPARAAVTWKLNGVTFADGATAGGHFTYDFTSGFSNIAISIAGGTIYQSGHDFGNADVNTTFSTFNTLLLCDGGNTCAAGSPLVYLVTQDSWTNSGVTFETLLTGTSTTGTRYGVSGSPKTGLVSGTVVMPPPPTSAAVPEPTTWAMMLAGIGGLGLAFRTRRRPEGVTHAEPANA